MWISENACFFRGTVWKALISSPYRWQKLQRQDNPLKDVFLRISSFSSIYFPSFPLFLLLLFLICCHLFFIELTWKKKLCQGNKKVSTLFWMQKKHGLLANRREETKAYFSIFAVKSDRCSSLIIWVSHSFSLSLSFFFPHKHTHIHT